ncbi:TolC family protein [Flammeovirga pectinis]|nr:TolC family protein [Flammeovirga pectinis]
MKKIIYFLSLLLIPFVGYSQKAHSLDSIPESWNVETNDSTLAIVENVANWWKIFNDPILNELVNKAVDNNLNIKVAVQRIEQGRLIHKQSQAAYYPSVALNASANFSNVGISPTDNTDNTMIYNTGVSMYWEIDVFGRIRKGVKAANYSYKQAQEDMKSVMVSVLGEVSSAYVRLRMYQNQIIVAESNIKAQLKALDLARDRFQSGLTSKLDVLQAEAMYASTNASIHTLNAQVIAEVNLIQVFIGEYPERLKIALLDVKELPGVPVQLQTLLPVDMVRQRPDIKSAENGLMAMVANEELANAELLPTLAIQGNVGFVSNDASDWINSDGLAYYVGPKLSWNLFSGLYEKRNKQIAKVEMQQAQLNYQNTVLTAMKEVENSLSNIKELKGAMTWLDQTVSASEESVNLSIDQYQQGIIDYQPVLNSQQSLLLAQNEQVQTKGNLLGQIIALYQSLGGNWVE